MTWNLTIPRKFTSSKAPRVMLLLSALLVFPAYGQNKAPQLPASKYSLRELHGGIELSMRGAQAVGLRISGEEDNLNISIIFSELILAPMAVTDGKFTPESIRDMVVAVQKLSKRLQQDYRILPENIYLTGTPSLIASNVQDLVNEIRTRTNHTVTLLDVESAVQLAIAGGIPRRYKLNNQWYDNRNASVLIEVMGNKVQGGYQVNRLSEFGGGQTFDFVTFEIPKGSIGLTAEANKIAGAQADRQAFARATQSLMENSVRAPLRAEANRKLGIVTRKKVYMSGPFIRILALALFPDDTQNYLPITTNDINVFYSRLISDPDKLLSPDLSRIQNETTRQRVETELQTAKVAFSVKEMIAGAEALRALASELELQNKQIFYSRYSHLAPTMSFIRLQREEIR